MGGNWQAVGQEFPRESKSAQQLGAGKSGYFCGRKSDRKLLVRIQRNEVKRTTEMRDMWLEDQPAANPMPGSLVKSDASAQQ